MSSRGEKESTSREPRHLKFSVDDKVEVLSSEEGFAEAWAHAVIVSHYKGGEVVEYSKFVSSETGRNLKEKVRALNQSCSGHRRLRSARIPATTTLTAALPRRRCRTTASGTCRSSRRRSRCARA